MTIFGSASLASGIRSAMLKQKGDANENVWISMLETSLPKRYQSAWTMLPWNQILILAFV